MITVISPRGRTAGIASGSHTIATISISDGNSSESSRIVRGVTVDPHTIKAIDTAPAAMEELWQTCLS